MKQTVKEAIKAELEYIDSMEYGEATTTRFIMGSLGYELRMDDMIQSYIVWTQFSDTVNEQLTFRTVSHQRHVATEDVP